MKFRKICFILGLSFILIGCEKNKDVTKSFNEVPPVSDIKVSQTDLKVDDILNNDLGSTDIVKEDLVDTKDDNTKRDVTKETSDINTKTNKEDIVDSSFNGKTYGNIPMVNVYNLYCVLAKDSGEKDVSLIPTTADEFVIYMDKSLSLDSKSGNIEFERFSAISLLAEFSGHFEDKNELEKFLSVEGYEIDVSFDKYSEYRTEDGGISMSFSSESDDFKIAESPDMTNREIIKESKEIFFSDEFKVVVSIDDTSKNIAFDFYSDKSVNFDTDSFSYSYNGNDYDFYINSVFVVNSDSYSRILLEYNGDVSEVKNVVLTDNLGHDIYIN